MGNNHTEHNALDTSREMIIKGIMSTKSKINACLVIFMLIFLLAANVERNVEDETIKLVLYLGLILHNILFFMTLMDLRNKRQYLYSLLKKND